PPLQGSVDAPAVSAPTVAMAHEVVTLAQIQPIMAARCVGCHSAKPTQAGFPAAPAGIMLDTPQGTLQHAEQIKQVVGSKYMPLANMTAMTDAERAVVAAWNGK
ncbi:MAG TPA: c-type cytochrome, partial [Burkholderiaceae bacterium]|nr:c-type cytochrome [Burkholderiaceae bacterium]